MTYAGLICAAIAIALIAHIKTKEAERGCAEANAFYLLVARIESEIRCYRTPLSEIFKERDGIPEELGFMDEARAFLRTGLPPVYRGRHLTRDERDTVEHLFAVLGSGTADEELTRLCHARDRLCASVEKRKAELPKQKRLYRVTALSLALILLILFI